MFDFFRKKGSSRSDSLHQESSNENETSDSTEADMLFIGQTARFLSDFISMPLPDAIDGLLFRVSMADPKDPSGPSGFERYAARILSDVDADALRHIAAEHPVELRRLNTTGLFWLAFDDSSINAGDRATILRVESALNRLIMILAHLKVSDFASSGKPLGEDTCSLLDCLTLRSFADNISERVRSAESENQMLNLFGTAGKRGGNWDLNTRFAQGCEYLALPFRLEYRFACDSETGTIVANVSLPTSDTFPQSRYNKSLESWETCTDERPLAATSYALRLAALIAGVAFGCGVGVVRVIVNGHRGSIAGETCLSVEFERTPFMTVTLPHIRRGEMSSPGTDCNPAALLDMLCLRRSSLQLGDSGELLAVHPLSAALKLDRTPLAEDMRPLPAHLRDMLHADTVSDLDVMSEQDPQLASSYRAIMEESSDSLLLAVAQLEDIVAEADRETEALRDAEKLDGSATRSASAVQPLVRPLYCENIFARYLVDLIEPNPQVRYRRVSDIGQAARSSLSRMYRDMGDFAASEDQARKCAEAAPTSATSYNDLITCYAEDERFDKIIDVAKEALRVAVTGSDAFYLYYRLAFAYWRIGCPKEALACYLHVPEASPMGEPAARERAQLVDEMGANTPNEKWDPDATLRAAGVPIAPTFKTMELIAKALIELCDAGIPLAAAPLAGLIANTQHSDALHGVAASLRERV